MHPAQDLELLVHHAYPEASEDVITILLCDQFVDTIDHQQLRICVQQTHPTDMQEALARDLRLVIPLDHVGATQQKLCRPTQDEGQEGVCGDSRPALHHPWENLGENASLSYSRNTAGNTASRV